MNASFMRLLAERLEHVCWVEVVPEECSFLEFFDSMDGFFMSSDLKFWNRPPGFIFGDEDCFIGSIEDWAVELIQEQRGYFDDYEDEADDYLNWVPAEIDDEFNEREVWLLACRALGLGEMGQDGAFFVDDEIANALLRPSGLYGRMRGVTPRMVGEVLRRFACGMPPQDAWALVGERLRESRLKELAAVVEKLEVGVPGEGVADWSFEELAEKLTHFSMVHGFGPWVMADGRWCGDLSVWAYKLYGATAELSFGADQEGCLPVVSSVLLGLGVMEGVALFQALGSPCQRDELDVDGFRKNVTPEIASEALRKVAGGVFASVVWDGIYDRLGLHALLDGARE